MRKLCNYVRAYFPSKLPIGVAAFEAWADSIIELSGEFADKDSMYFVLAAKILELGHQQPSMSKRYFVKILYKTASNQVASHVLKVIKDKQQAEVLAEQTKKQAEATASAAEVASDESRSETQEN